MTSKIKKILVIRNDKLGDFVLSLPTFSLLKKYLPDTEIHAFVPPYTKDIALLSGYIDKVIVDPGSGSSIQNQINTLFCIKQENYAAIITLFSTTRVGLFSFFSGTKYRLAPATKISQIFYNHRLTQRRSQSLKPEYEYNLDLATKYLADIGLSIVECPAPPYIKFDAEEISTFREIFFEKYKLDKQSKLIFIHPGSGGSATNLSMNQYADLATNLNLKNSDTIVITAGPGEEDGANNLSSLLKGIPHVIYHSTQGLVNFTKIIQLCDLFISSSTGPLHIAGALNRPTAAFYQRRRSATPLRWQTLNSSDRRLAFTPPEGEHESDLGTIDVIAVASEINRKFLDN